MDGRQQAGGLYKPDSQVLPCSMSPERNLQQDMFTGDLVDNRTRTQKSQDRKKDLPQQEFLFSQRELAVPSRQRYFETPSNAPLVLQSQDPRSDEERERDEQRAIEAAMAPLFGRDSARTEPSDGDEDMDPTDDEAPSGDREDGQGPATLRREVYLELVRLSEEQAETLWIAPPYEAAYITQLRLVAAQARSLGLTDYEVALAMQIGTFRGERRKAHHAQLTK